jgi:hypothetical protein
MVEKVDDEECDFGRRNEVSLDFLIRGPQSEQFASRTFKADSRSSTDQMVDVDPN